MAVEIGSRWVAKNGRHKGTEAEILDITGAGRIVIRHVGGEGASWDNGKSEAAGRHTLGRDMFLAHWQPKGSVEMANGAHAGRSFRQNNVKLHKLAAEEQIPLDPEQETRELLGQDPVQNGHYVNPGMSGLGITVELVTPAMAQAWLERGGPNRRISERRVLRYMTAIQIGEWEVTGETIKFNGDGELRDGQHRLTAIVRTGIAVPCIVVRGVKESAFDKIDTGGARNMSDVLSIHGRTNTISLATAARGLMLIERYGRYDVSNVKSGGWASPSNAQGLAYVEAHPEVVEAVSESDRLRKVGRFVGGSGLWAIALTLFWRINPEQTRVYVDSLIEGANLESGSPILKLRNLYKGGGRDWHSTTENRERLLAVAIKGWNAWRRDELVQALSWHNTGRGAEKFPVAE